MDYEKMVNFLESLGIKTEKQSLGKELFQRCIKFKIYDIDYTIVWYVNESKLLIGSGERPAVIPFRYMYFDTTYPLVKRNESIGFSYTRNDRNNMIDREYPYEVLRIPLELPSVEVA